MSYILDALRRAEAERERGAVPSLQSQQHTVIEEDDARAPRPRRLVWVVVGLGVALAAVLTWNLFGGSPGPARPIAEGTVAPTSVPPLATPAPIEPALPATTAVAPPVMPTTAPVAPAPTAMAPLRTPSPTLATLQLRRELARIPDRSPRRSRSAPRDSTSP